MTEVLTIERAGYLADLIRGVEAGAKLAYYPSGADTVTPLIVVLRAFTYDGGGLYPRDKDIRDAHVWTSGMFERWFTVRELLDALENTIDASHGMGAPMASWDL